MVSPPPPPPNGKVRNPRKGRTFVSKVPTVTGMSPRTGDPRDFQAMQLRGVSNAATLSWTGQGFGPRCAQLLTLNPKPVHIYAPKP